MLAKFEPKEYNKLEDTDYKMEEYVRVPKGEYEELKENRQGIKTLERHKKLLQSLNDYQASQIVKLEQQLQAYKDKEDKLRDYMSNIDNWNWKKLEGRTNQINRDELLQILNEKQKLKEVA
jgi:hypothetical protein